MKKIEKEEQLKKKLEQTMEEKMAADSKTVEGESAVVKAEEGNTVTEQEPEAAPALSEEELNANSNYRNPISLALSAKCWQSHFFVRVIFTRRFPMVIPISDATSFSGRSCTLISRVI